VQLYTKYFQQQKRFDLTIMDLTVPGGMGGEEAAAKIIKFDPKAKIIAASGYSTHPILADYAKYGFCGILTKPFGIEDLNRIIIQNLNTPQQSKE
jgi:DNA-binding NtrC family response regulator